MILFCFFLFEDTMEESVIPALNEDLDSLEDILFSLETQFWKGKECPRPTSTLNLLFNLIAPPTGTVCDTGHNF